MILFRNWEFVCLFVCCLGIEGLRDGMIDERDGRVNDDRFIGFGAIIGDRYETGKCSNT